MMLFIDDRHVCTELMMYMIKVWLGSWRQGDALIMEAGVLLDSISQGYLSTCLPCCPIRDYQDAVIMAQ